MQRYAQYAQNTIGTDGILYLSGLSYMDFLYSGPVKAHIVAAREAGRLDLVSWVEYSDPTLWWVIYLYNLKDDKNNPNGISDPVFDVVPQLELLIPTDISSFIFKPFTYLGAA